MNKKIKEWATNNGVSRKELAVKGGISQASLSTFISGKTKTNSEVIEAWAKEWPEMICYALDLQCDGVDFIPEDDDESARLQSIIDKQSERIAALEQAVFGKSN